MKKVISFVLALAMVLGMCSMVSFADSNTGAVLNADTKGMTVVIGADQIVNGASVTVKYNKNEVSLVDAQWTNAFGALVGAYQEIEDVEEEGDYNYVNFVVADDANISGYTGNIAYAEFALAEGVDASAVDVYEYFDAQDSGWKNPSNELKMEAPLPNDDAVLLYGDADLDGKVTVMDALTVLKYIVNNEAEPIHSSTLAQKQANINKSDDIDTQDAMDIVKVVAGVTKLFQPGMKVANPFAGLDLYEPYNIAAETNEDGADVYTPVWTKGVSIAYWIKAGSAEDALKSTAVASFETPDRVTAMADENWKRYAVERAAELGEDGIAAIDAMPQADALKTADGSLFYLPSERTIYYGDADGDGVTEKYTTVPKGSYGWALNARPNYVPIYEFMTDKSGAGIQVWSSQYAFEHGEETVGYVSPAQYYWNDPAALERWSNPEWFGSLDPTVNYMRMAKACGNLVISSDAGVMFDEDIQYGSITNLNTRRDQDKAINPANNNTYMTDGQAYQVANEIIDASSVAVDETKWHYVVVTIENDQIEVFVDGVSMLKNDDGSFKATICGQDYATAATNSYMKKFNLGYSARGAYRNTNNTLGAQMGNMGNTPVLEWISENSTELYLGGINDSRMATSGYRCWYNSVGTNTAAGNMANYDLANIAFYDTVIDPTAPAEFELPADALSTLQFVH